MTNKNVLYKSQWDADAGKTKNDCGAAAVAMILNYYGEKLTTDQVFVKTGAGQGLIGFSQLINAIKAFGYEPYYEYGVSVDRLKQLIDADMPPIALVHYGSLNSTQDKTFKGGHFFPVVGYRDDGYFVNDPNFQGNLRSDGDHHFYTKAEFEKAWNDCYLDGNPNRAVIFIKRKQKVTSQTPNMYGGLDISNQESMKPVVDLFNKWKAGGFVEKTEYDKLKRDNDELRKRPVSCPTAGDPKVTDALRKIKEIANNVSL